MANILENTMNGNIINIFTNLNTETTNGMLSQLVQWVEALPDKDCSVKTHSSFDGNDDDDFYIIGEKEESVNRPKLKVYINSDGGSNYIMRSILNMFYIAKIRGAIIETYNIGRANSASSMIAVSGTPGHRYMNEYATHTIHYGKSSCEINHPDEAKFAIKDFNNVVNMVYDIYLSNTKLTKKDLSKYLRIEGSGQLSAKECLQKGVCDYVITKHKITHSIADLKRYTSR